MVNIHFSARTVRGLVYVFMENRKAPAKTVVGLRSVPINESNNIAGTVTEPPFASITNAGLVVKRVKVGACAVMEN